MGSADSGGVNMRDAPPARRQAGTVQGEVAAGYAAVQDVFADILAASTGGCSFCVVHGGQVVVDLWGGTADPSTGTAWRRDTAVLLFSGTKGLAALVLALLVDRGVLDPDDPVSRYWPEFAHAGKQETRVRHLATHTAGLPYVDPELADPWASLLDQAENSRRLAAQRPLWPPGEVVAYHPVTFGVLLDELVRRATGSSVGELFNSQVGARLGLDVWLGAPDEVDHRVARLVRTAGYRTNTFAADPGKAACLERMYGFLTAPGDLLNSSRLRRAGHPAISGLGTATGLARMYSALLPGAGDHASLIRAATLDRVTRVHAQGIDRLNGRPVAFGLGFELQDTLGSYGPVQDAFGHSGAGGGIHGAWPGYDVAFSFCTNELRAEDADGRAKQLLSALAASIRCR